MLSISQFSSTYSTNNPFSGQCPPPVSSSLAPGVTNTICTSFVSNTVLDIGQITTIEFANAISGSSYLPYSAYISIYNGPRSYNSSLTVLAYNTIGFSINAMQATVMNVLIYNSISSNALPQTLSSSPSSVLNFNFTNIAGNYSVRIYEKDSPPHPPPHPPPPPRPPSSITINALPDSYNYNIVINSALTPTSITSPLSIVTIDSGQSYPISISRPTTGTSPYTYSWSIANGYSCPGFSSPGNDLFYILSIYSIICDV